VVGGGRCTRWSSEEEVEGEDEEEEEAPGDFQTFKPSLALVSDGRQLVKARRSRLSGTWVAGR
jgi:hypothetical protein